MNADVTSTEDQDDAAFRARLAPLAREVLPRATQPSAEFPEVASRPRTLRPLVTRAATATVATNTVSPFARSKQAPRSGVDWRIVALAGIAGGVVARLILAPPAWLYPSSRVPDVSGQLNAAVRADATPATPAPIAEAPDTARTRARADVMQIASPPNVRIPGDARSAMRAESMPAVSPTGTADPTGLTKPAPAVRSTASPVPDTAHVAGQAEPAPDLSPSVSTALDNARSVVRADPRPGPSPSVSTASGTARSTEQADPVPGVSPPVSASADNERVVIEAGPAFTGMSPDAGIRNDGAAAVRTGPAAATSPLYAGNSEDARVAAPAGSASSPNAGVPDDAHLADAADPPRGVPFGSPTDPAATEAMIRLLLQRGDAAVAVGDIVAARLLYERAANLGSADGARSMGKTYDAEFLRRVGVHGIRADQAASMAWFRKAAVLGDRKPHAAMRAKPAAVAQAPLEDKVRDLLQRGDAAVAAGDVILARPLYERAAALGSASAATSAGKTYDIEFLLQDGAGWILADPAAATAWFRKAAALGDPEARTRLARLHAQSRP